MNRQELVDALAIVRPALSKLDIVPIMTYYLFKDNKVFAYNDKIAIFKSVSDLKDVSKKEQTFAVPGTELYTFMLASSGEETNYTIDEDDGVTFSSGKGKIKLPLIESDHFLISPDLLKLKGKKVAIFDTEEITEAFNLLVKNASPASSRHEYGGITIYSSDDETTLFCTDNATITEIIVDNSSEDEFSGILLPQEFCRAVAHRLASGESETSKFYFGKSEVIAVCGDTTIYGKLPPDTKPLDYISIVSSISQDLTEDDFEEITEDLKEAFRSISRFLPSDPNGSEEIKLTYYDKPLMELSATYKGMNIEYSIELAKPANSLEIYECPANFIHSITRMLTSCDRLAIFAGPDKDIHLMEGDKIRYFVS